MLNTFWRVQIMRNSENGVGKPIEMDGDIL